MMCTMQVKNGMNRVVTKDSMRVVAEIVEELS